MQNLRAISQEYYDQGLVDGFSNKDRETTKYTTLTIAYNYGYDVGKQLRGEGNDFIPLDVRLLPRDLWETILNIYLND